MPAVVPSTARPPACPEISPDAPLVPLPPFEAYAADVDRLDGRAPLGPVDDAWLALAHALARAAALPKGERAAVVAAGARAAAAALPIHAGNETSASSAARALIEVAGQFGPAAHPVDTALAHAAARALQPVVAEQEQAGAFLLAFTTLASARRALHPSLDARSRGLLLAQQGRVARQLGALSTAAKLYRAAARAGRAAGAPEVVARALLGGGVLANMRGNYPEARTLFRKALRASTDAGSAELLRAGHHGLLRAALAAHDTDVALAHGWAAVLGLSPDAADQRAEMLVNLGEVGRQAGEHRAALGACLSALELTDVPRVRLPALGTAALAAARLNERRLLAFLAQDVERVVARSGQPFENAHALVELAEAYAVCADDLAISYAERASALAHGGLFHEVAARADLVCLAMRADVAGPGIAPSRDVGASVGRHAGAPNPRSRRATAVLRSLEALPAAQRYTARIAR